MASRWTSSPTAIVPKEGRAWHRGWCERHWQIVKANSVVILDPDCDDRTVVVLVMKADSGGIHHSKCGPFTTIQAAEQFLTAATSHRNFVGGTIEKVPSETPDWRA
jgi:hypothetical protein